MIALDTNLVVRLVVQDEPAQSRAVERLFIRAHRDQEALFIADIVLCELVWVLARRYQQQRSRIADTLDALLRTELVVFADEGIVSRASAAYRRGKGDFADYLIREQAVAAEATDVVTLDKALKGEEGFRLLT